MSIASEFSRPPFPDFLKEVLDQACQFIRSYQAIHKVLLTLSEYFSRTLWERPFWSKWTKQWKPIISLGELACHQISSLFLTVKILKQNMLMNANLGSTYILTFWVEGVVTSGQCQNSRRVSLKAQNVKFRNFTASTFFTHEPFWGHICRFVVNSLHYTKKCNARHRSLGTTQPAVHKRLGSQQKVGSPT